MATQEIHPLTQPDDDAFEVAGNRLRLMIEGADRLDAVLAAIAGAERELLLIYYIFAHGDAGTKVRDALVDACRRGVSVSLLVDGFGSEDTADGFFQPLRDAGGEVCRFLPRYGRRYLLRNHQKMLVADEKLAVIGGFNIEDAYFAPPEKGGWRDAGMVVEGPAVAHLAGYFRAIEGWTRQHHAKIKDLNAIVDRWSQPDGALRWLFGGPTRRLSPWAHALHQNLKSGRRLSMIAGYFTPNPGAIRRLGKLARRGEAHIVTAAKSDNDLTIAAARHCYRRLLRRRASIAEYQPGKLHTKLYVVDDTSYVGSANFDIRSLYLNLEIMLRVEDRALADRIRKHVAEEEAKSRAVSLRLLHDNVGWWGRLKWRAAYFVVAILDFSVTRRINFGGVGKELD